MNWDKWLPWRNSDTDIWGRDVEDSPYYQEEDPHEDDDCDHEWDDWTPVDGTTEVPITRYDSWHEGPKFKEGYLVFTLGAEQTRYCINCGKEWDNTADLPTRKVAIPAAFTMDLHANLEDALTEPVESESDSEDGGGRVIINEEEQTVDIDGDD